MTFFLSRVCLHPNALVYIYLITDVQTYMDLQMHSSSDEARAEKHTKTHTNLPLSLEKPSDFSISNKGGGRRKGGGVWPIGDIIGLKCAGTSEGGPKVKYKTSRQTTGRARRQITESGLQKSGETMEDWEPLVLLQTVNEQSSMSLSF